MLVHLACSLKLRHFGSIGDGEPVNTDCRWIKNYTLYVNTLPPYFLTPDVESILSFGVAAEAMSPVR